MTRIVAVTINVACGENTDVNSLADIMFNVAEGPTQHAAELNEWDVEFLDAKVTSNTGDAGTGYNKG